MPKREYLIIRNSERRTYGAKISERVNWYCIQKTMPGVPTTSNAAHSRSPVINLACQEGAENKINNRAAPFYSF